MEKTARHPPDKLLPDFAPTTFERWAEQHGPHRSGARAARPCSSRPATCRTTSRRSGATRSTCSRRTRSTCACVQGPRSAAACRPGSTGDLDVRAPAGARTTSTSLMPFVERGREGAGDQPDLLDDDAARVPGAAAEGARPRARASARRSGAWTPREFLWAIRDEPRFNTDFKSTPGRPGRLPRALPPARAGGRLQGPRPAAQDPRRRAEARRWSAAATTAPTR